jgi:glycerol kinase
MDIATLRVDGGATANNLLMHIQADVLGVEVVRPKIIETTALGATYLAGLAVGYWRDRDEIAQLWQVDQSFHRTRSVEDLTREAAQWQRAIRASLVWANE